MLDDALLGALIAFWLAAVCTPVGVSGAVFLVPVQVSLLHTPSPAVTPTNLLYNLIAIPGALLAFHGQGRLGGPLVRVLVSGSLAGVIAGAVIRVVLLPGLDAFYFVIASVLIPLGSWLLLARPARTVTGDEHRLPIMALAVAVGTVGGIYGIGGGSILGPILVGLGFTVTEVAPAALAATFLTSLAGVATYGLLSIAARGDIAPEWIVGLALGLGGLIGSYLSAAIHERLPETFLRRALGLLALILGLRYAVVGFG